VFNFEVAGWREVDAEERGLLFGFKEAWEGGEGKRGQSTLLIYSFAFFPENRNETFHF